MKLCIHINACIKTLPSWYPKLLILILHFNEVRLNQTVSSAQTVCTTKPRSRGYHERLKRKENRCWDSPGTQLQNKHKFILTIDDLNVLSKQADVLRYIRLKKNLDRLQRIGPQTQNHHLLKRRHIWITTNSSRQSSVMIFQNMSEVRISHEATIFSDYLTTLAKTLHSSDSHYPRRQNSCIPDLSPWK